MRKLDVDNFNIIPERFCCRFSAYNGFYSKIVHSIDVYGCGLFDKKAGIGCWYLYVEKGSFLVVKGREAFA